MTTPPSLWEKPVSRRTLMRGLGATAATVSLGALAAGCASPSGGPSDELLFGFYGNPQQLTTIRKVSALFKKKFPDIRVRETFADPAGFFAKLPLLFRSGAAPDVFFAAESWISGLASLGGYEDLGPRFEKDGLKRSDWLGGSFNAVTFDDKTLGLPFSVYPRGIGYNRDVFKKRGMREPTPGWTQADFLEMAEATTFGSGQKRTYGSRMWFSAGTAPYDLVTLYGGMLFELGGSMTATDPKVVKAVQFASDLINKQKVAPSLLASQALGTGLPSGRFGMDLFVGYVAPDWIEQIGKNFAWDVAPFPEEWKGTYQNNNVCVYSGSQKKDAAWEFAKFVATDPEAQAVLGSFATPVLAESATSWLAAPPKEFARFDWQPMIDQLKNERVALQGGSYNKIWSLMNQQNQRVQLQGVSAEKAMQDLQTRGNQILSVA